jgi:hypothetical protein
MPQREVVTDKLTRSPCFATIPGNVSRGYRRCPLRPQGPNELKHPIEALTYKSVAVHTRTQMVAFV